MTGAQAALLPDGRLHLHHGPIDLIVEVWAAAEARRAAYAAAWARFAPLLEELVAELPALRRAGSRPAGPVAARMAAATRAHAPIWVTPMAAVAGAVADAVLAAMTAAAPLARAVVNNGGDVALHLAPGEALTVAGPCGPVRVAHADPVRGVATSGWRGRSFSLGIADAVTVLARTAAEADVAATLIANAVDLPGHPAVARAPARARQPDSDLGDRLVTVGVGPLSPAEAAQALDRGLAAAAAMRDRGLILSAALLLAGRTRALAPEPAHA
jgi:ApbE superfamily uncharacterized protein (UPF0280 family)